MNTIKLLGIVCAAVITIVTTALTIDSRYVHRDEYDTLKIKISTMISVSNEALRKQIISDRLSELDKIEADGTMTPYENAEYKKLNREYNRVPAFGTETFSRDYFKFPSKH